jgi:hypothetical protein
LENNKNILTQGVTSRECIKMYFEVEKQKLKRNPPTNSMFAGGLLCLLLAVLTALSPSFKCGLQKELKDNQLNWN